MTRRDMQRRLEVELAMQSLVILERLGIDLAEHAPLERQSETERQVPGHASFVAPPRHR